MRNDIRLFIHGKEVEFSQDPKILLNYKEKELTWWQRFRLKAFWWQLLLNVLMLLFIFRKPLLKLFVK